jgi:pimeloyl-ACP methyl ester carboxylesterase
LEQFEAADGARIAFTDEGEGRPLVLLHGLMAHAGFFEPQRSLAAEGFRLVRIDLRGHGDSVAGAAPPTVETLAGDVAAITAHLDLEDAILVGWSLGASVLWRVLVGPASPRFVGAVVVDMTPRVMNDGDWDLGLSREICDARSAAIRTDFPAFAASAGQAIFAGPSDDAQWASNEFARNDPAAIGALWSSLVEADFRPLLGRIAQPTLIIHGTQSHLYGSGTADHLAATLPNARAVAFHHSGHAPHLEQPELFNRTVKAFAASLPPVLQPQTTA